MSLKNMAMDAQEAKEYGTMLAGPDGGDSDLPRYPYGLTICLNDDSLAKLAIPPGLPVGTKVMILAAATVVSCSQRQTQDGDSEANMDIQITDMDIKPAADDVGNKSAGDKLYPTGG